jgi:CDP-diacylglycerol--serine O-phosphatidyltransferase
MMKRQPSDSNVSKRRQVLRKSVYVVPSLLTMANIFCGFYSMIESLKGFQSLGLEQYELATRHFNVAALCIGWSVLFDFLDGRIARMANATSEFGVELDSIADVLSFGLAPAVLAYAWGYNSQLQVFAWGVSFLFLVCGALRLARFNVQARKVAEDGEGIIKPAKKYFVGLPIPAGASLIASIIHFAPVPVAYKTAINFFDWKIDSATYTVLMLVLMTVLAFLMVSTLRYNSFKSNNTPHKRNNMRLIIIIALMIFVIYQWSEVMLLVMAICYSSLGPVSKLFSLLRPQNSVTPEVGLNQ